MVYLGSRSDIQVAERKKTFFFFFVLMSIFLGYCFIEETSVEAAKNIVKPMNIYLLNKGRILYTLKYSICVIWFGVQTTSLYLSRTEEIKIFEYDPV